MFLGFDDITVSSTEYEKLKLEIELLKRDIELYRHVIKESNDWLMAGKSIIKEILKYNDREDLASTLSYEVLERMEALNE